MACPCLAAGPEPGFRTAECEKGRILQYHDTVFGEGRVRRDPACPCLVAGPSQRTRIPPSGMNTVVALHAACTHEEPLEDHCVQSLRQRDLACPCLVAGPGPGSRGRRRGPLDVHRLVGQRRRQQDLGAREMAAHAPPFAGSLPGPGARCRPVVFAAVGSRQCQPVWKPCQECISSRVATSLRGTGKGAE